MADHRLPPLDDTQTLGQQRWVNKSQPKLAGYGAAGQI